MAFLTIIIATIMASTLLLYYFLGTSNHRELVNKMPGPPALPIVGNAHMFKSGGVDFYFQLRDMCALHGHKGIFRVWLAMHVLVIITKAEQAEALLNSSKHITKSLMYKFLMPWLGTGLLTSTGAKWHSRRKLLTPTFHFQILSDFLEVFNEQARVMVKRLATHAEDGRPFNVTPYITQCALDTICVTAMGVNVNAQGETNSVYVSAVNKISDLIMKRIKTPYMWPDIIFRYSAAGREHQRCLDILHNFTNKVISDRSVDMDRQIRDGTASKLMDLNSASDSRDSPETKSETEKPKTREAKSSDDNEMYVKRKRLVFMDMLLYASKTSSAVLSADDIREEVDTFMFEGHDTTAAAINWIVYMIGAYPEVQKQLLEEVDSIFNNPDRSVTMDDFKELRYMDCVIKETMRLYPIVPLFAREVSEDCNIGGFFVPKGSTAVINVRAVQTDANHFSDPEKFDPDRWLSENLGIRNPFSFVPFSAGPRNCIGQKFAMMEMRVLLSSILRQYTIKSIQRQEELRPTVELILRPDTGIIIELSKRNLSA